jgi:DNA-directed RNA polymerase specialized sigma24 family protein
VYVKPAELKRAVEESQAAGTITPELYRAIVQIAKGVHKRYGLPELEDTIQDAMVCVLTNLDKLNPEKPVFSYLTTIVRNCGGRNCRVADKFDRLRHRVYDQRPR